MAIAAFGGLDWPHPNHRGLIPEDGEFVDLIAEIALTAMLRKAMSGRLQDRIAIGTSPAAWVRLEQWPRRRGASWQEGAKIFAVDRDLDSVDWA